MKLKYLLPLFALAACSLETNDSNLDTSRLRDGDNGDSAECQACAAEVEACLVNGGDCAELYFECERICLDPREPEPPGDDCPAACEQQLRECHGGNPDGNQGDPECEARFEECLQGCEPVEPPEPCQDCEAQLDECLAGADDNLGDRDECWWRFEECSNACHEPPPGGDCDHCELGFEECVNEGGAPEECQIRVEECLLQCRGPQEPVDPTCGECDVNLEQCLIDAGDDPAAHEECWARHGECCNASCD